MGRIFCIMGKSASGKDTVYQKLRQLRPGLRSYVMYSTRPRREGEVDGVSYHFVDEAKLDEERKAGRLIEARTYQTVFGPWTYATVDDGQIDLKKNDYLMPATLESYRKLQAYFPAESVVPVYIEVEDGERLLRAIHRERQQDTPKYVEMCRRFIADSEDFSEEKLRQAGISHRFINDDADETAGRIALYIDSLSALGDQ